MTIEYKNKINELIDINKIDLNKFNKLSKIYSFTTENIAGYFEYLNLENKTILTVAGSGDHIINVFFKGAKKVYGFDINYLALIYTELKLVAMQNLDYKEFLNFFMINEENNIRKNKNALNYKIYITKIRNKLSKNAVEVIDILYESFKSNGFELRNSDIFNNKYDNNKIKKASNLYLKNEKNYEKAKKQIKNIVLMNINYKDIDVEKLPELKSCDTILMSNISDYIKNIYNVQTNYLELYIRDIIQNLKNNTNQIVCAYLYNIENTTYRSEIDDPIYRKNVFNKLNIKYKEKNFKSVMKKCKDSIIIV